AKETVERQVEQVARIRRQAGKAQKVWRRLQIFDREQYHRPVRIHTHTRGAGAIRPVVECDFLIGSDLVGPGAGRQVREIAVKIAPEAEGRVGRLDRVVTVRIYGQRDAVRD